MKQNNEILDVIQKRTSAEFFTEQKIDRKVLERILEAGRLAPSAKNRQAWRFIAVDDSEIIEEIQYAAYQLSVVGEAASVIALCTTNVEYKMPNGQLAYPIDLSFAASFMMLQAEKEGIASRAITTYNEERVKEILTVPYSMRVVMLLVLGYTENTKTHKDRKDLNTIISYNHW